MAISREQSIRLALDSLSPSERDKSVVYLDTSGRRRGDVLRAGPSALQISSPAYVFFVDLQPGMNWSHPSRVIFVNEDDGAVLAHDVRFPPFTSDASDTFRIVHRPPKLETWKLLTEKPLP